MTAALAVVPVDDAVLVPRGCRADAPTYICDEVASGRSLKDICGELDVPAQPLVHRWLRQNEPFRQQYFDAYKTFLTLEIPNILEIADGAGEEVKRDTLKINTRIKLLEKLAPDQFGAKVQVEVNPLGQMMAFIAAAGQEDA